MNPSSSLSDGARPELVENIKQGEYVKRKADSKKVYIRKEYDASEKAYWLQDADDISGGMYVKKGKTLFVGFTY